MCLLQVRQHGGGEYTEESHSQGSSPDAPDAMFGFQFVPKTIINLFLSFHRYTTGDHSVTGPGSGHQEVQLGFAGVDIIVRQLINQGITSATRTIYLLSAWRRYTQF